nr:phage integrase SAM-like domain-containing protein [Winogradskyella endarachnes]
MFREGYIDFENYLTNVWPVDHPRAISKKTIMKHIQHLRKMITLAYHLTVTLVLAMWIL